MSARTEATSATSQGGLPRAVPMGGRIQGALDVVRPDRIGGWAIDRTNRAAALEIDIFREGRRVATIRADRERKDLARGEDASGNHGFALALDPPLEPGFEFTLAAIARTADGASCALRRTRTAGEEPTPERRLLERILEQTFQQDQGSATPSDTASGVAQVLERLEVAQARIEAALDALAVPAPRSQTGLIVTLAASLALGVGSLCLGLYSMLS